MHKLREWILPLAALIMSMALCAMAYQGLREHATPELSTSYHAVALTNGQVFFGRIEGIDTQYPVLRDVFYVQTRQNPETKQVANILIKRGGEAHSPDRMMINKQQLLLVEPVKDDSQIGQLIAAQNKPH